MKHVATSAIATIASWAASEPLIQRVHLFGSRVRGWTKFGCCVRPDSDLDIAIELLPTVENPTLVWFEHGNRWGTRLAALLPYHPSAWLIDKDSDQLRAYLAQGSVLIFERQAA